MNLEKYPLPTQRQKWDAIRSALELLEMPSIARKHDVPRVLDANPIPIGRLKNNVRADYEVQISGRRTIFLRIETTFDTRPKRKLRCKIEREQKKAGTFAPVIFIFGSETADSILRKVVDVIKIALANIDRKWRRYCLKRHSREGGNAVITRDFSKFPHRLARAA